MLELLALTLPALPALAALGIALVWLLGLSAPERTVRRLALLGLGGAALGLAWVGYARWAGDLRGLVHAGTWLTLGDLRVDLAVRLDTLGLTLAGLAVGSCLVVARFGTHYMHREVGFIRFFGLICLFCSAMLLLFLSANMVGAFAGWELAGLCSALLIGYAWDRPTAIAHARYAYAVNRAGDAAFLLGIGLCWGWTDGVGWAIDTDALSPGRALALALCFAFAAAVKSAQVPFSGWIFRAMEGPTPTSALFYGTLLVSAGPYLLLRLAPLLQLTPVASSLIFTQGLMTALLGSLAARVMPDTKSALITAAVGSLGLVMALAGLGFQTAALIFLVAHAATRGAQLLTAPSVLVLHAGAQPAESATWLRRHPGLWLVAFRRLWLEELLTRALAQPLRRLGASLDAFDRAIVDRATGSPVPSARTATTLARWEESHGEGHEDAPSDVGRGRGLMGRTAQVTASALAQFEERLVLEAIGHGLPEYSGRLAGLFGRVEAVFASPWFVFVVAGLSLLQLLSEGG